MLNVSLVLVAAFAGSAQASHLTEVLRCKLVESLSGKTYPQSISYFLPKLTAINLATVRQPGAGFGSGPEGPVHGLNVDDAVVLASNAASSMTLATDQRLSLDLSDREGRKGQIVRLYHAQQESYLSNPTIHSWSASTGTLWRTRWIGAEIFGTGHHELKLPSQKAEQLNRRDWAVQKYQCTALAVTR